MGSVMVGKNWAPDDNFFPTWQLQVAWALPDLIPAVPSLNCHEMLGKSFPTCASVSPDVKSG